MEDKKTKPASGASLKKTTEEKGELSSISVLLKKSFKIYKTNFWKFVGIMLVPLLGIIPLLIVLMIWGLVNYMLDGGAAQSVVNIVLGLLGVVSIILIVIISIIAQAGLYVLVKDSVKNHTIKEAFTEGKKYAWRFVVVNLVTGLFVMLWMILFIIPGIVAVVFYSMAMWVLFYEGYEGTVSLKRSKELIKGHWWGVFGRFVLLQVIVFSIIVLPSFVLDFTTENQVILGIWNFIVQIISFLISPFVIIYTCFMYWDLRKIKGASKLEHKKSKGAVFTVIVILLIIIGLFSSLAVASLENARQKYKNAAKISDVKMLQTELELYRTDNDAYPDDLNELNTLNMPFDYGNGDNYRYSKIDDNYELCFDLKDNTYEEFKTGENCVSNN